MTDEELSTRFRVEGMDCASCASKIETAVRRMPAVADVGVSVVGGTMNVTHDRRADVEAIERKVSSLGYRTRRVEPGLGDAEGSRKRAGSAQPPIAMHGHDHADEDGPWWAGEKARLTIMCGFALAAAFVSAQLFPQTQPWGFILAMAVGLIPIARRAAFGAMNGTPFSIEMLMTVAAIGAVVIDASEEAAVVVFLFLVGELLEGIAAQRARASIRGLANLMPRIAQVETQAGLETVATDSLRPGAIVVVRPGDRIAADGVVLSGESAVDEAPVTGESVPKRKHVDDAVFAGTVNHDGVLRVRVTAASNDNTIARIVALVEEAQESKAPTERFIDRFSKYYTPGVMIVALLVALVPPMAVGASWDEWIYKGLAILLIGCPCALVISTPAAIAAALSAGARRGLLMKGGAVLESLGKVDMVAFDKTGTLTEGKPQVTDIVGIGVSDHEVLRLAATLESGSSHPLAVAIIALAKARNVEIGSVENGRALGGEGVSGEIDGASVSLLSPRAASEIVAVPEAVEQLNEDGKTVSILITNQKLAGLIALRDEAREDARPGLERLSSLGADAVMLTGDNKRTAEAIGAQLGIAVHAELMPQDKKQIVESMRKSGKFVAKVGDGINDAPALAAADIGIAMGGGTDIALETADAAVLHGRVTDVANMVILSRETMANILQNITISLGLKAVFLVTTIIGVTGLWPAILADTGATILVTMNAMRLLAWRGQTV